MTMPRLLALLILGVLLGLSGGNVAAQAGPDYIKITPPPRDWMWRSNDSIALSVSPRFAYTSASFMYCAPRPSSRSIV